MPTYSTSTGERLDKKVIDKKVRQAKAKKLQLVLDEKGYISCEDCGISGGTFLDCSHDISVKECQESGRSEMAFDVSNITIRCRNCHRKHDKTL